MHQILKKWEQNRLKTNWFYTSKIFHLLGKRLSPVVSFSYLNDSSWRACYGATITFTNHQFVVSWFFTKTVKNNFKIKNLIRNIAWGRSYSLSSCAGDIFRFRNLNWCLNASSSKLTSSKATITCSSWVIVNNISNNKI